MKLRITTLIALFVLAGALAPVASGRASDPNRIQVRILPVAEVFGETFTLGEIAELDGFDIEALKALSAAKLGRSPLPGRTLRISEPLIRSRLTRIVGAERFALIVPRNATVTRAAIRVPGEEIEALVLERAERDVGVSAADLKQELRGRIADALLPKGEVAWEIRPLGHHLSPSGGRTYLVVARVDGNEAWRTTVRLNQKIYREVVVARTAIRRNQVIAPDDVRLARRPFNGETERVFLSDLGEAVGQKARRPIGPNEPIDKEMLSLPFAVAEGGRVRVLYETPQIVLEAQGVALIDGRIGDFIPVKNLQSGKIVYGVLEDNETLRVN